MNSSLSNSIHLKTMKTTHTSIIPEEYEPYSTGRWSVNPHAAAIQNQTSSSFAQIKREIEREYNMYQKVELHKQQVNKFMERKRRGDLQANASKLSHVSSSRRAGGSKSPPKLPYIRIKKGVSA